MDRVEQSDIRRGEILVPGGWSARIPSICLAREEEEGKLLAALQKRGYGPVKAAAILRRRMQDTFNRGWIESLRRTIAARAEEYREIHGSLEGFEPERVQRVYFPGDNFGRAGKPGVREMLVEMGEEDE